MLRSLWNLRRASQGIRLADLIALASVGVATDVYRLLEPVGGIWHPDRRRPNLGLRDRMR